MNIELIKKYKKEFDYWLNKGSVIKLSEKNNCLQLGERYEWDDENEVFIINDEYVELRIAAAEGKTIQVRRTKDGENYWDDLAMSCSSDFQNRKLQHWRIKPTTFKAGEFLVYKDGSIFEADEDDEYYGVPDGFKLWEPQADEVHWFARNKDEEPVLGKFVEMITYKDENQYVIITSPDVGFTCSYFKYCEPFIGTLPTKWRNK